MIGYQFGSLNYNVCPLLTMGLWQRDDERVQGRKESGKMYWVFPAVVMVWQFISQSVVLFFFILSFCFLPSASGCLTLGEGFSWPQSAAAWIWTTRSRFSDTRSASLSPDSRMCTTCCPGWLVTTVTYEWRYEKTLQTSIKELKWHRLSFHPSHNICIFAYSHVKMTAPVWKLNLTVPNRQGWKVTCSLFKRIHLTWHVSW